MVKNVPGDANTAWLGKLFYPCGAVNAISLDIIALLYDISKIYPSTKLQRVILLFIMLMSGKGALNATKRTGELDKESISQPFEILTIVFFYCRLMVSASQVFNALRVAASSSPIRRE